MLVLVDFDNLSHNFWFLIAGQLPSDARLVGAGLVGAAQAWGRVFKGEIAVVPPGKNLADEWLDRCAMRAFEAGEREFLVCSSDNDLLKTVRTLRTRGAMAERITAKNGILRRVGPFRNEILMPQGIDSLLRDRLVVHRMLVSIGANHGWKLLCKIGANPGDFVRVMRGGNLRRFVSDLGCADIRCRPNGQWEVRLTGPLKIRVPARVNAWAAI